MICIGVILKLFNWDTITNHGKWFASKKKLASVFGTGKPICGVPLTNGIQWCIA